jgi:Na+:H+ antiporter
MHTALVLLFAGLIIFLAHLFVYLFEKTRVPDVLYLIIIGVVLGPLLHLVTPEDFGKFGQVFASIALVIILFEGGLDLSIEQLRTSLRSTATLTSVSFALMAGATTALAYWWLGFDLPGALFIGVVLATPSPAVIIPLIRQLALSPKAFATLMLESPLGEALGIVLALAILDSLQFESIRVGRLLGHLLASLGFALLIGTFGGVAWSLLLHRIRQLRYAIFTTPAFLLVLYGVTEFLGFSGPVSALTFGITLGNVGEREIPWLAKKYNLVPLVHNDVEKAFFGEIVFLIKTFFFIYLGLSIRFSDLQTFIFAGGLTGALLLARIIAVRIGIQKGVVSSGDAAVMGILTPKGTATAVLAALPLQMGLQFGGSLQDIVYAVILTSIVGTSILVFVLEKTSIARAFHLIYHGIGRVQDLPSQTPSGSKKSVRRKSRG